MKIIRKLMIIIRSPMKKHKNIIENHKETIDIHRKIMRKPLKLIRKLMKILRKSADPACEFKQSFGHPLVRICTSPTHILYKLLPADDQNQAGRDPPRFRPISCTNSHQRMTKTRPGGTRPDSDPFLVQTLTSG